MPVRGIDAIVGPSEEAQFQTPVGDPRPRTFHQSRTTGAAPENMAPRRLREKRGRQRICQKLPDQASHRLGQRPE